MQANLNQKYSHTSGFETETGFRFPVLELDYSTWGKLNKEKTNVVVIYHALTGHSNASEWFSGLFEKDGIFKNQDLFVICINVPGSCYGSTGPSSVNPETGEAYGHSFPILSIRDVVKAQQLVLDYLKIEEIQLVIGGSMGGMQALECAITDKRVQAAAVIAAGSRHEAWAIGISEAQRMAIYADARWSEDFYDFNNPPLDGLAAARAMAMLTYRAAEQYNDRFGREIRTQDQFQVSSYLKYQGEKIGLRFDPLSYVRLTQSMDTHDVGRGRGGRGEVLSALRIPVLVAGIQSDLLYPIFEQQTLAEMLPNAIYREITSPYGHDAFLIEFRQLNDLLKEFTSIINHHKVVK
ncbi:MAG: homoserine O-acetyltransferase [Balneolales bacterium]|nr:homoserine O-acetyltransferase [Balneolales bacterium]